MTEQTAERPLLSYSTDERPEASNRHFRYRGEYECAREGSWRLKNLVEVFGQMPDAALADYFRTRR